jgi:DNA-directed RNA polymerase subunit RPC12/RpoP
MSSHVFRKSKTGLRLAVLRKAERLSALGARPPFIKRLLPALGARTIRRIYRDIVGRSPRPGKWGTESVAWWQVRRDRRLEAGLFYRASWTPLARVWDPADLETFLCAYQLHLRRCRQLGIRPSPIECLWQFLRYVDEGVACVVACDDCGASYLVDIPVEADRRMSCPYCRAWSRHRLVSWRRLSVLSGRARRRKVPGGTRR